MLEGRLTSHRKRVGAFLVAAVLGASVVAAAFATAAPSALAAPGDLDTSFSGDGKVRTNFTAVADYASGVAIQADGKIVAAGYASFGYPTDARFALARYNRNGTLDTTFSGDGKVRTDFSAGDDWARAVAIQADGKIVAVGTANGGAEFALARYNANGSLDTTFGGDGKVRTNFTAVSDGATGVAIQADGKIVAAGNANGGAESALARYNPDGTLDTTFGGDGKVRTNFAQRTDAVAIQADGKIVAAGRANGFALARFNPNGSLDTSFGGAGQVTTSFAPSYAEARGVAIQADGKIVAAGTSSELTQPSGVKDTRFALARYNPDGTLDTAFSANGKVTTNFTLYEDLGSAVAIQADGKIVAVGTAGYHEDPDLGPKTTNFALARYNPNGRLDTTFSGDGKVRTHLTQYAWASAVAIQANGKIVAAGRAEGRGGRFALARYLSE
jgi:uncharacterized delta-60 repeat protein